MSELIYLNENKEPVYFEGLKIIDKYRCSNPLVFRVWFWAMASVIKEKEVQVNLEVMLHDGTRETFKVKNEQDTEEAEKWLQLIKNKKLINQ